MEGFGKVVKRERTARGWSQQRLANAAELNRSHVTSIEKKDGVPQLKTVQALAKAFGVLPRQLLEPTGRSVIDMLPQTPDVESDELVQLFDRLTDDDRERLVVIARALYQHGRRD